MSVYRLSAAHDLLASRLPFCADLYHAVGVSVPAAGGRAEILILRQSSGTVTACASREVAWRCGRSGNDRPLEAHDS
jgi:hypothetical protein